MNYGHSRTPEQDPKAFPNRPPPSPRLDHQPQPSMSQRGSHANLLLCPPPHTHSCPGHGHMLPPPPTTN